MAPPRGRGPAPEGGDEDTGLPTREEILRFIEENPAQAQKRDIARAFGVKGPAKIPLKRMLKQLAEEGALDALGSKRFVRGGGLPPVAMIEIVEQDLDGELIARPILRDGETSDMRIVLAPDEGRGGASPALGIGDRALAKIRPVDGTFEARVIRRLDRPTRERLLGIFERHGSGGELKPVSKKTTTTYFVEAALAHGAENGELVLAQALPARGHGPKRAKVVERLGDVSAPGAISLIAIHEHGIPVDFPPAAIAEAEAAGAAPLGRRTDLRHLPLVTIDPPDARDHDDAVYAHPDEDPANPGGHVVYVAIADVAHYVTSGSALDREARRRGNSCYFPDRVVPMLPERLSAELCSLKPKVDRPVMVVRLVFGSNGVKRSHSFIRGMMRSAARLTYAQVQAAVDGEPDDAAGPLMEPVIRPLWTAYQCVLAARERRGPLDLNLPETRIELDATGRVARITTPPHMESQRLIEEFMIQANVAAAETAERRTVPLLYRVHDQPSREKLEALAEVLRTTAFSFAKGQTVKPAQFNTLIARAKGSAHEHLVSEMVLRSQAQARYSPENIGHFGLNLQRYAHFTSPIRRYADLVVHRALITAMKAGEDGLTGGDVMGLADTAELISAAERRAMAAERDSKDRYIAAFLESEIGMIFEGRIVGVTRFGLFVKLAESGADGLIPIRELGNEFFQHDEGAHALVGTRSRTTFRLGESISVRLVEAAPVTGGLRFALAEGDGMPTAIADDDRRGRRRERDPRGPRGRGEPARGRPGQKPRRSPNRD